MLLFLVCHLKPFVYIIVCYMSVFLPENDQMLSLWNNFKQTLRSASMKVSDAAQSRALNGTMKTNHAQTITVLFDRLLTISSSTHHRE